MSFIKNYILEMMEKDPEFAFCYELYENNPDISDEEVEVRWRKYCEENGIKIEERKMTKWEEQTKEYQEKILECCQIKTEEEKYFDDGGIHNYNYYVLEKFDNKYNLSSIVLPDDLVEIAEGVFENSDIEELYLPKELRSIGLRSFKGCKKLTKIYFNNNLHYLGREAFYGCSALSEIKFNSPLYGWIGELCFKNCFSLETVMFYECAIEKCKNQLVLGRSMFGKCKKLKKVYLPDNLARIDDSAFWGCASLSEINFPKYLGSIGWNAFMDCHSLGSVDLSDTNAHIEEFAFAMTSLKEMKLPNELKILRRSILSNNDIETLKLGPKVEKVLEWALNLRHLKTLYIADNEFAEEIISNRKLAGIPDECEIIKY